MGASLLVPALVVALVAAVAVLAWLVGMRNRITTLQNATERAWANVDVVLQQRGDEVPNLVAAVRGYAQHEAATLARLAADVAASRSGPPASRAGPSERVTAALPRLVAVAQAYPALKADASFLALQRRLSALEDLLADRREFYNESVRLYNTRIAVVPDVWLARRMRVVARQYFQAEPGRRAAPSFVLAGTGF